MKRFLSLVLALAFMAAMLPAMAEPVLDPEGNLPETLANPNLTIVFWMSWNGYRNMKANNPTVFEATMEAKERFEKKYGGKVDIIGVNWNDQLQKTIDMQQAGDAPDLVLMFESVFHNAVLQGIIQNLDAYVDDTDYGYWNIAKDHYMWKNSHYAVPIKPYFKHITFNRTMFEYEGLEAPDELYARGAWNFDAFLEAGRALTYDTNGDGEIDQYGFSGYGDTMSHLLITNGGGLLNIDQANGRVTSALKDPQTLEAIEYMTRMQSATDGMWLTEESEMFGYFDNNALGMIVGKEIQDARMLPFEVGLVPYPYGPSGNPNDVYVYSQALAVPTGADNPEAAVAYIRMVNEVQKAYGDAKERERYGKAPDGVTDMYDLIYENHKLITRYDQGLADVWAVMATIENYMGEGVPASTIAERVDPLINAEIEKAFSKQ